MSEELAAELSKFSGKGYVIAPAGYGKTHLIALAVKAASKRQLVLTHTFAGVNSIKTKMTALGVPSSKYQVDTIASWSLRLCLAYPKMSCWKVEHPTDKQWNKLYESCVGLLEKKNVRRIIESTYEGIYVDEYQDCSSLQHTLICTLAESLNCRILGDPMQAIFNFGEGKPVDWKTDVYPSFVCLGQLETPWRWNNAGNPKLGAWLKDIRSKLKQGQQIDLLSGLPSCVSWIKTESQYLEAKQYSTLCGFLAKDESVIALHGGNQQFKNKTHSLARSMAGKFSSIEEVEGKDIHLFIKKLESTKSAQDGFLHALEFAKKCFTGVDKALTAGTKRGEVAKKNKSTRFPVILDAANSYLIEATTINLKNFFLALRLNTDISVYRRDLFYRFINILKLHVETKGITLSEAAKLYQRDMRHTGRPIKHKKLIATTLLVKGLEYDHAVILDADSLSEKDLYVAITRGAKSLTLIGRGRYLPAT